MFLWLLIATETDISMDVCFKMYTSACNKVEMLVVCRLIVFGSKESRNEMFLSGFLRR